MLELVGQIKMEEMCVLGLQRFVDVIDYVDYKNTSISMECNDESDL